MHRFLLLLGDRFNLRFINLLAQLCSRQSSGLSSRDKSLDWQRLQICIICLLDWRCRSCRWAAARFVSLPHVVPDKLTYDDARLWSIFNFIRLILLVNVEVDAEIGQSCPWNGIHQYFLLRSLYAASVSLKHFQFLQKKKVYSKLIKSLNAQNIINHSMKNNRDLYILLNTIELMSKIWIYSFFIFKYI